MTTLSLIECFGTNGGPISVQLEGVVRREWASDGTEFVRDDFTIEHGQCLFIRIQAQATKHVRLSLGGSYTLRRCAGVAGWLIEPSSRPDAIFWAPRAPMVRRLDALGRITAETPASLEDFGMGADEASVSYTIPESHVLEWVLWRLDSRGHPAPSGWVEELMSAKTLECQPFFIYASHSSIKCAADFYQHLIHGSVYGASWAWPKKRKICDELDALSLHIVAAALEQTTSKRIYHLLRRQVVLSVLARQQADGGFRHGEWTDQNESHNRLLNGAVQLLANEHAESPEPALANALQRAAAFLAAQVDQTSVGAWFLHDSLEMSEEGMRHYPFGWTRSRWLGKSPTNLLILNTHLDCMLSLNRFQAVTGDASHAELVASAGGALQAILAARPADWLFRPLLRIISLSLLPKAEQERLPFVQRILKRIGWKYAIPRWHLIRKRFPRLVMPGGYMERSLGQGDFVHRYHGVHLMDFERLISSAPTSPPSSTLIAISNGLVDFAVRSRVTLHWKESLASKDSLGFWTEGLYRRYLRTGSPIDQQLLATAVLDLTDAGLGLPPSLLGTNGEIQAPAFMVATPSPIDRRLRVVNFGNRNPVRFMVINTANVPIPLAFENETAPYAWSTPDDHPAGEIPARSWLEGRPVEKQPDATTHAFAPRAVTTTQ